MTQYEVIAMVIGIVWFVFIALWGLNVSSHEAH